MRLNSANWLAPLRAREHALLRVLLPMLAASALSAPACAAMLAAATTPEVQHAHGGAHVAHDAQPSQPTQPCPHCPLEAGLAPLGHEVCVVTDSLTDDSAARADSPSDPTPPPVLVASWLLPAARAAPVQPSAFTTPALVSSVSLNVLHCVLLI
jgi:hypothetical protein